MKKIIHAVILLFLIISLLVQIAGCSGKKKDVSHDETVGLIDDEQAAMSPEVISSGVQAFSESSRIPGDHSSALLPGAIKDAEDFPDLTTYDMKLNVDFDDASYEGSAEIEYSNLEDISLKELYFRLFPNSGRAYGNGSLQILSAKVDGQDIRTEYTLGDSAMKLILPAALSVGDRVKISLRFNGKVPLDYGGNGYGIFNLSENVLSLAGWFPIIPVFDDEGWNIDPSSAIGDSVYTDMAYFDVEVTADDDLKIISTGIEVSSKKITGGKKQHNFVSGPSRDFVLVLSPDFQSVNNKVQGTEISVYYFRDNKNIAKETLETAAGCLEIFNERFGPYPYTELDLVEVPMNGSIGIEFPGIVLFGSLVFGDTIFTAHEVAHQWWYNMVGNDIYDDPWLDEALTTYSSLIYLEEKSSSPDFQQVLNYFKGEHEKNTNSGGDDIVTEGLDHFEELGGRHYSLVVYVKGALFYDAVRRAIGDEAFYSALQDYYQDRKYRIATPADILDRFEEASGQQLDNLYEEWLFFKK